MTSRAVLELSGPCTATPGGGCGCCITPSLKKLGCGFIRLPAEQRQRQQFPDWAPVRLTGAQEAPIMSECLRVEGGLRGVYRPPADANVWEPRE